MELFGRGKAELGIIINISTLRVHGTWQHLLTNFAQCACLSLDRFIRYRRAAHVKTHMNVLIADHMGLYGQGRSGHAENQTATFPAFSSSCHCGVLLLLLKFKLAVILAQFLS